MARYSKRKIMVLRQKEELEEAKRTHNNVGGSSYSLGATLLASRFVANALMGDKIQASVRKALLPRFENKIKEGSSYNFKSFGVTSNTGASRTTKHQFKLNFHNGTIVTNVRTGMATILSYIIKLECMLFGPYIEALDAFLQSGCNGNVVVVAHYLKVKLYNGKVQLQNTMNSTKLLFNPEIPEADNLKVHDNIGSPTQPFSYMKYSSEMSLEEEFLNLSQRKTIKELEDCQDGVVIDSKRIFYTKCKKHVWTIVPRYRIKLEVIYETDSATFVVFDHDCYLLTKKMCTDLIDQMDRADELTILQIVIGELVEQTMVFNIVVNNDVNYGFEQSFCVKKLCPYQDIVAKFKNVVRNFGGVEDNLAGGVVHNDIDVAMVQDLGSKFENITIENKCGDNGSASKLIEENVAKNAPVKRGIDEVVDENDETNSRITKNIKIEKALLECVFF
ncbi:hypothetical protein RYX36_001667 [Vicia faba]